MENNKVVITILGIQSANYNNEYPKVANYEHQARYYFSDNHKEIKDFFNTLPLLVEYFLDRKIIPIYTKESKYFNADVLKHANIDSVTFDDNLSLIEDDKDFKNILKKIDSVLNICDDVIVDLTHGFRHLPLLMLIDLIMHNIKNKNKIQKILFAKEIVKHTPKEKGEYEIIDLKEYLDLANLSFIITNFKDNYTISSNIRVSNKNYQNLLNAMGEFSRDLLALSMQHFFHESLPKLKKAIEEINHEFILRNDLEDLKEHLKVFEFNGQKKYEIYFNSAKEFMKKNYLLQSVNILHEAKLFYLKTSIKNKNEWNKELISKIEDVIEKCRDNKYNTYKLLKDCQFLYCTKEENLKKNKDSKKKALEIIELDDAIKLKASIIYNQDFANLLYDSLRNNLAHANSEKAIENVKNELSKNIVKFEELCIKKNILKS